MEGGRGEGAHERKGNNNKGADAGFQRGGRRRGLQQQLCAVNTAQFLPAGAGIGDTARG